MYDASHTRKVCLLVATLPVFQMASCMGRGRYCNRGRNSSISADMNLKQRLYKDSLTPADIILLIQYYRNDSTRFMIILKAFIINFYARGPKPLKNWIIYDLLASYRPKRGPVHWNHCKSVISYSRPSKKTASHEEGNHYGS